jgi:hypothetical protein
MLQAPELTDALPFHESEPVEVVVVEGEPV